MNETSGASAVAATDWLPDPQRAQRDAMSKTPRPGNASYYYRCDHYRGDEHCKLAAGHAGKHVAAEEDK
jgi:hypothetical protein